jgi:predicted amidophosphoribosyltransferase
LNTLDAARQMIRYALEEEACWHRLHGIVEEERERLYPPKPQVSVTPLRAVCPVCAGPMAARSDRCKRCYADSMTKRRAA